MNTLLYCALWVHLAACVLLTGSFFLLLMAGPPPDGAMSRWEDRIVRGAKALVLVALASGAVWLATRAALFENRDGAALDPRAFLRAMLDTWPGVVWMVRHGLLLVLAVFLWFGGEISARGDWFAARGQAFLLSVLALVLLSGAGHTAAIADGPWPQVADVAHLLGAGVWAGGLPALAGLLHAASRNGAVPDAYAVRAMRRFSHVALAAVLILAFSGSITGFLLVQSLPGLLGTTHGHLLLAKLAALAPALGLASLSRALLPRLSGPAATKPADVARRMAWFVALEAALVLLLLAFAAAMIVTTPARHGDPVWPLPFRLSLGAADGAAVLSAVGGAGWVVATGCGLIAALAFLARRRRGRIAGGVSLIAAVGAGTALLAPLAVEAFPTSYARAPISFHAVSIAKGKALYETHCASCHVIAAEARAGAAPDLVAAGRIRSAGELFWLAAHGHPANDGPAADGELDETQHWHIVNFLRARATAGDSRAVGPEVKPENGWLAAPDFTVSMGPLSPRALRDFRGRRMVLLVLYSLPESRERMTELARRYGALSVLGVEVVAVSPQASESAIAALAGPPPVLFPVVTAGNGEIEATYRLFAPGTAHAEFLIDRQGYIRALWRSDRTGMPDAAAVQAAVERLNEEKAPPPLPDDHFH